MQKDTLSSYLNQIGLPEAYNDEDEQIAVSVSGLLEDN